MFDKLKAMTLNQRNGMNEISSSTDFDLHLPCINIWVAFYKIIKVYLSIGQIDIEKGKIIIRVVNFN